MQGQENQFTEKQYLEIKDQGKAKFLSKKFEEAIEHYKSALKGLEDNPSIFENSEQKQQKAILNSNIGFAYSKLGQNRASLAFYDASIAENPQYEKSLFRKAQALYHLDEHSQALGELSKLQTMAKDPSAISLKSKLIIEIQKSMTSKNIFKELRQLLDDSNSKRIEVRDKKVDPVTKKETIEISTEESFLKQDQIEWQLVSLSKVIEKEDETPSLLKLLFDFYEIFRQRELAKWRTMLTKSNYLKVLSIFFVILQRISQKKLSKAYLESYSKDTAKKAKKGFILDFDKLDIIYEHFWEIYSVDDEKLVKDIILSFPVFFRNLEAIKKVSLLLKVQNYRYKEKDTKECRNIQFFFQVLSKNFKGLADRQDPLLNSLESEFLKKKDKVLLQFLDRVSRSNSKEAKSFLVAFLRSLSSVYDGKVSDLLFKNMTHLYRDSFSFQSILLMNSLLLSDFPTILDDLSLNQPIFVQSVCMLLQHLNHLIVNESAEDEGVQFKLENSFQLLTLCLTSKKFIKQIFGLKDTFMDGVKTLLENSYQVKSVYSPRVMAKSMLATVMVILELFPSSIGILDDFVPLSKVVKLLKMTESVKNSDFDETEFLNDSIDILCYIAKSEGHVMKLASNDEIYKILRQQLDLIPNKSQTLLHTVVSLASALIDDKTTKNQELAQEKWGADMEGFKLLEQLRQKVAADTPTLLSKYTKDEIEKSGVKMRLLKDLNITSLLAEYFSKLKSAKLAVTTQKGILNFLLMISEEKKYRPYIVNKGVIEYLKMMFDNEATKKPMREKIDKLVSRIGSHVNPMSLSYSLRHFVFDILCHGIENSFHELIIFESLLGLTNFIGQSQEEFSKRFFFTNKKWPALYGHLFDENLFVSTSAFEVLNNLLLNQEICLKLLSKSGYKDQFRQIYRIFNSFIDRAYQDEKVKGVTKVAFQSDLQKIKVCLGILCIMDYDQEFTKELAGLININKMNRLYGDVKDKQWLKEVDVRVKHLIGFLRSIKENLGAVVTEIGAEKGNRGKVLVKEAGNIGKRFGKADVEILVSMFGGGADNEQEVD